MILLNNLPFEILIDIVSFVPSFNRFLLKEVNSNFFQVVSKYFGELSDDRWICSFQSESLWNHFNTVYNTDNHNFIFKFALTQLLNDEKNERHLVRNDFFISFKPLDLPLSYLTLKRFVTNGRVDLLDFYIENDSHLNLTIEERTKRLPFESNSKFYEYFSDRQGSWMYIAIDCVFSSTLGVLEWFEKHIDVFAHILKIPTSNSVLIKIKKVIESLYPNDEYQIHDMITVSSHSLKNLCTKYGFEEMVSIFFNLDMDYVSIDLNSLDDIEMLNNLFPNSKHHVIKSLANYLKIFLKSKNVDKISSILNRIDTTLKSLKSSDFLLNYWRTMKSETVFMFIFDECWFDGTKIIDKWEIDLSVSSDLVCNFRSSSLSQEMVQIVDWFHKIYLDRFKGNESILRVCCNILFILQDCPPSFYSDKMNSLQIQPHTEFPKIDITSFSDQALLWIYYNVPQLYNLNVQKDDKFSLLVESQPTDGSKVALLESRFCTFGDFENCALHFYYNLKEESLIEPVFNYLENLNDPELFSDFRDFSRSVISALEVRFLKKLNVDPERIFYNIKNVEAYREFKKIFMEFSLKDFKYQKKSHIGVELASEMSEDGVIFSEDMKNTICELMTLWGNFHLAHKIFNKSDLQLLERKLYPRCDKQLIKLILDQVKMNQSKTIVPIFTNELENKIKLWIQQNVLDVILTPAGKRTGILFEKRPKIQLPEETFDAYLDHCLSLIKNYFGTTNFDCEEEEVFSSFQLIEDIFPIFATQKDDGGNVSDLYDELRSMVFGKTYQEMRMCNF